MKNHIFRVRVGIKTLLLIIITILFTQYVFSQDTNERDWQIRVPSQEFSAPVIPGNMNYMLWNLTENASVKYRNRKYGINLVWASSGFKRNIRFEPTSNEPIKYGDRIAIWVAGGGYLKYSERKYGINLKWSKKPVYEWEIRGGENGKPVQTRVKVAIYNTVEKDYVLYCERPYGINLKWSKTCESSEGGSDDIAAVSLFLRIGPYTQPSTTGKCTGRIIWSFTPVRLTGFKGKDQSFTIDKNYEGDEDPTTPGKIYCIYSDFVSALGLKIGTWKISARTPAWSTECTVDLHKGNNRVNFTLNRNGCKTGGTYPGD